MLHVASCCWVRSRQTDRCSIRVATDWKSSHHGHCDNWGPVCMTCHQWTDCFKQPNTLDATVFEGFCYRTRHWHASKLKWSMSSDADPVSPPCSQFFRTWLIKCSLTMMKSLACFADPALCMWSDNLVLWAPLWELLLFLDRPPDRPLPPWLRCCRLWLELLSSFTDVILTTSAQTVLSCKVWACCFTTTLYLISAIFFMYTYTYDVASCGWHAFFIYRSVVVGIFFMLQHTPANQFLKCVASQYSNLRESNGIPSLGSPLLTKALTCSRRTVDDIKCIDCSFI